MENVIYHTALSGLCDRQHVSDSLSTADYKIYTTQLILCVRWMVGESWEREGGWWGVEMNEDTQRMMACIAKHCLHSITCAVIWIHAYCGSYTCSSLYRPVQQYMYCSCTCVPYMYMYVHVCVCVCVCMYMYMYVHNVCVSTWIQVYSKNYLPDV